MNPIETDLHHHKNTLFELRGQVAYQGIPRDLVGESDVLEFSISDADTNPPIIYKVTDTGIQQDSVGGWILTVAANELDRTDLPLDTYRHALRILPGGDATLSRILMHGTLYLEDIPFSIIS